VKDDPSGLMPGISTRASAIDFMRRAIDTNSVKELASIRTHVETSNANAMRNAKRFSFEERMTISAPVESIYNALWDVARWPSLLPYCLNVDLRYDDQYRHQEFIMTVEAGGEVERLRTVRIGTPNKRIEYFQVNPPPALISHSGEWLINQGENGAELISAHTVAANYEYVRKRWGEMPESVMEEKIRNSINGNSLSTMLLIKKSLEQ
jgi:aromatase